MARKKMEEEAKRLGKRKPHEEKELEEGETADMEESHLKSHRKARN